MTNYFNKKIEHSLHQQVSQLKRKTIENEDLSEVVQESETFVRNKKPVGDELGKKSIFYDPDWNPSGKAPFGLKNIPYNPRTFQRETNLAPRLNGLEDIPLPKSLNQPNRKREGQNNDQDKKS